MAKVIYNPVGFSQGSHLDGTRYGGGTATKNQRYSKGYFYMFLGLPLFIQDMGIDGDKAIDWIRTTVTSFTPPGDPTLNIQDDKGQGGVDSSFLAGSQTLDRSFSTSHKEMWGSPIRKIFDALGNYVDPYVGASLVADQFVPSEYKFYVTIVQTKPVARRLRGNWDDWKQSDLTGIWLFDGVQTTTRPSSQFDSNIEDQSIVDLQMQYKFDGHPLTENHEEAVKVALSLMNGSDELFSKTIDKYDTLLDETAKL